MLVRDSIGRGNLSRGLGHVRNFRVIDHDGIQSKWTEEFSQVISENNPFMI